ncbi:DEAD/DEAH box helicase [Acidithiobacillus ferrooxidans]|jgi:ATP-dependent RNA helicase DeaD|uniref:ATP-dependent RNA helicase DeaD n=6 Tax=Acidithiobacillus TaxID=119977 RepID=B7J5A5_ACIF2|nr:DEAD/DEAH box helicase [Acidithiobacillus ferrooxidans]MCL5956972.1 DEAD/DEAH box helicase [Gammaproteobacteria bacterium]ACH82991.1 DEAD/DEAH box helicase domain protein [Acidithiobacillus ferrooxidans ATCC 53993]ACK79554.1 ATP-dependent RNA helicase, DEAD/DEAH box family [Acidithiobacillus ferrooxidans ATCC 23270]MBU2775415.1 DEAD/DEAH box helicase [Acidithiobacillus ferrooxidans]MCR0968032.1 DEAD/DEAH box helicase [Acidithiobacillus ferrooxidans]
MSQETDLRFIDFALAEPIQKAVTEIGYEQPSPIQAQSIPPLLEGRDVIGLAQTGTGKTAAFALPLLSRVDLGLRAPQLLVLAPTRELAIQVAEAMQSYAKFLPGFHVLPIYGGQAMTLQLKQLQRGVQVVVGTPGRIQDHLRRKTLRLDHLQAVVLDEADEMLRMGFIDAVEDILKHTPEGRQVALFSATMPDAIRRIAKTYLRNPLEIRIKSATTTVAAIRQRYWQVSGTHKLDALTRILEVEESNAWLVFVRTKTATVELAERLEARGYACGALNGDLSQAMREQTIERLKAGTLDIVVATDVAARGLDVDRISHVINYDIPNDTEAYVHRIGRTGRAGRTGDAILFVAPRERHLLHAIERATGQTITAMHLPSIEDVADRRMSQFKDQLTEVLNSQDLAVFETLIADYQRESDVGLGEIAAALAYMVQKERPLIPVEAEVSRPMRSDSAGSGAGRPPSSRRRADDERGARPPRAAAASGGGDDVPMRRFRLDVGESHGAQVKNIVGAIANEAGIPSRNIRKVQINAEHTTVELPADIQPSVLQHLQKVWVAGRPLQIAPTDAGASAGRASARPRPAIHEGSRVPRKILSARTEKGEYKTKERGAGATKRKKPAR